VGGGLKGEQLNRCSFKRRKRSAKGISGGEKQEKKTRRGEEKRLRIKARRPREAKKRNLERGNLYGKPQPPMVDLSLGKRLPISIGKAKEWYEPGVSRMRSRKVIWGGGDCLALRYEPSN